jgi:hypothetical protein
VGTFQSGCGFLLEFYLQWVLDIVLPDILVARGSSQSFIFVYYQGLESVDITLCLQCARVPLFLCTGGSYIYV